MLSRHAAAGLILVLGLGSTAWLYTDAARTARLAAATAFAGDCDDTATRLSARLHAYAAVLTWGRGLIESVRVDRAIWASFVAEGRLRDNFPGVFGLAFVQRVPVTQLADFEERMRREGVASFQVRSHPRADRGSDDGYSYVIKYHEPADVNRAAWGLDVSTWRVNRDVYDRAMRTGTVQLSNQMQLAQGGFEQQGIVIALPVFHPDLPIETPRQRREALFGWVASPIGMLPFFGTEGILDRERLALTLRDTASSSLEPLFESASRVESQLATRRQISFGGKTLDLDFRPASVAAFRPNMLSANLIGLGGVLVSLLLSVIAATLARTRTRAEEIAARMASSLQRSEREARDLAERAATASRAKSRFLANMSHEIRTPMTAILGYADLLGGEQAELTDRQRRDYSATIKENGQHLLAIINDLLDISRIEAGKMQIDPHPVSPRDLLERVRALMRVRAESKGLVLRLKLSDDLPAAIETDPLRLRQILVNLVGNAVKFTELGHVTIGAAAVPSGPDRVDLTVTVSDTGIGMNQTQCQQIFSAFAQGDASITRRFGGTGLGLSISAGLAELLGGWIDVQSTIGVGSTFTLRLPATVVAETPLPEPEPTAAVEQVASVPEPLAGVRVFFAEDGPDNQRLVAHFLKKCGAQVRVFDNGREALEALTVDGTTAGELDPDVACDLLLTDMQMPEMDGYSLASTLRVRGWTRPIVALTAHAMSDDGGKCLAAGCTAYATKPVDRRTLIEICVGALRPAPAETPGS